MNAVNLQQYEVRGILDGRITQLRRIMMPQPPVEHYAVIKIFPNQVDPDGIYIIGNHLWVREECYVAPANFGSSDAYDSKIRDNYGRARIVGYAADMDADSVSAAKSFGVNKTLTSHMPRFASRLNLEILSVKVQRLQTLSEQDAIKEGAVYNCTGLDPRTKQQRPGWSVTNSKLWSQCLYQPQFAIANAWNKANKVNWECNPWTWVFEVKRIEQ